jgi:hypothetical protein
LEGKKEKKIESIDLLEIDYCTTKTKVQMYIKNWVFPFEKELGRLQ